jgi:hypothetical protein
MVGRSSSSAVRRAEATRSVSVRTSMPSPTFWTQERRRLSRADLHHAHAAGSAGDDVRQIAERRNLHPAAAHASKSSVPSLTETERPSIFKETIFVSIPSSSNARTS